jgi:hypothetical protein
MMMKKSIAFVMALSLVSTLAIATGAQAKQGADNPPEPPECQIEDGGVLVCR